MKYMQNRPLLLDAACILQHSPHVEADFNSLEAKVAQFVSLCERLRAENNELKQQLAAARVDAKRLHEKIDGARVRLEGLLSKIPG
jgi:cell division protein ZapB